MWLTGNDATFTYTPDSGDDTYQTASASSVSLRFLGWGLEVVQDVVETTPLRHEMPMYTPGLVRVRGVLRQLVSRNASGGIPAVPTGQTGTLRLILADGSYYELKAAIISMDMSVGSGDSRIESSYAFVGSSVHAFDTIRRTSNA